MVPEHCTEANGRHLPEIPIHDEVLRLLHPLRNPKLRVIVDLNDPPA